MLKVSDSEIQWKIENCGVFTDLVVDLRQSVYREELNTRLECQYGPIKGSAFQENVYVKEVHELSKSNCHAVDKQLLMIMSTIAQ